MKQVPVCNTGIYKGVIFYRGNISSRKNVLILKKKTLLLRAFSNVE